MSIVGHPQIRANFGRYCKHRWVIFDVNTEEIVDVTDAINNAETVSEDEEQNSELSRASSWWFIDCLKCQTWHYSPNPICEKCASCHDLTSCNF